VDLSPYTPGAGHRPPVLAGRDDLLELWRRALSRCSAVGRTQGDDPILTGPRGIGKTATILTFADIAREQGYEHVQLQATAGNAGLVDSLLATVDARIDSGAGAWKRARRAFDRVASVSVSVAGTGAGASTHPPNARERTVGAESLSQALSELALEIQKDVPSGGLLVSLDEMQVAAHADLSLLAGTLHLLNGTPSPVLFAGSGLPHTRDVLDAAGVTHADRLFDLHPLPLRLSREHALYAIIEPARQRDVFWEPAAAEMVAERSGYYPAHIQLLADRVWEQATGPAISAEHVAAGLQQAAKDLDRRSFGPNFDRLAPRQLEFLTALACQGSTAPMAGVARALGQTQQSLSVTRGALIARGDIYQPRRGEIALAVPLFAEYLLAHYEDYRAAAALQMPGLDEIRSNLSHPSNPRPGSRRLSPGQAQRQPPPMKPGPADRGPDLKR
jgi:hypothetical protein